MKKKRLTGTILLFCFITLLASGCKQGKQAGPAASVMERLSDDSLMTLVQSRTFQYFWDGAEPVSGMAPERIHMDGIYPENDKSVVTTGGSGFGLMAILVGIERSFITREQGYERLLHIVEYLKKADRFQGAWPHWLYGETGKVRSFSRKDNGADLVETSFLVQGLLTAREYFKNGNEQEKLLAAKIDTLWREVNWNFFTRDTTVLFWHWSPDFAFGQNHPIKGYNECLITYVLAASSPTYPIDTAAYHSGWARKGLIRGSTDRFGYHLALNHDGATDYGGPLFWAHYSYLGLDPRKLQDRYADYWEENTNQVLINHAWCVENPKNYAGYGDSCWGLTAGYSVNGYAAHRPGDQDQGVINPTAAISSIPYTPELSLKAMRYFYEKFGDRLFGRYGFYDGFSEENDWFPQKYLAIDQGPIVVMIENYRTGLLWQLFMQAPEVKQGLKKLGFTY